MKLYKLRSKLAEAEADIVALSREEANRLLRITEPARRLEAYLELRESWGRSGDSLQPEDDARLRASFAGRTNTPPALAPRALPLEVPLVAEAPMVPPPSMPAAPQPAAAARFAVPPRPEPAPPAPDAPEAKWELPWGIERRWEQLCQRVAGAFGRLPRMPLRIGGNVLLGTALWQLAVVMLAWFGGDPDGLESALQGRLALMGDPAWLVEGVSYALVFGVLSSVWLARRRGQPKASPALQFVGGVVILGLVVLGVAAGHRQRFANTGAGLPAWPEHLEQTVRGWSVTVEPREGQWLQNRLVEPMFTEGVPSPDYALLRLVGPFGRTDGWWLVRPDEFRRVFGADPAGFRPAPPPERRLPRERR